MAIATEFNDRSRFTDVLDEPVDRLLSPIRGYEDKPLLPLMETIRSVSEFFHEIEAYVYVALHNCQKPADKLDQQESASIHLYTLEFNGGPSLYHLLNQPLRAENRDELKPWFSFLKLFLTALHKLPSQSKTVWRGVKNVDLSSKYETGTKFAWWGVSSCTTDIQVLKSNHFLGKHGLRTLFSIECINGKSIANHSYFKKTEKEIILMPGSYFEVIGQLNPAPELYIIHLKEISSPITLVKPPFHKPVNSNPPSVIRRASIFSQLTSNMIKHHAASSVFLKAIPARSGTRWKQLGVTVAGGNDRGDQLNQLSFPVSIFINDDQTIYIADWMNHRIVEWKSNATNGRIVAGGNGRGNQANQLLCPTDVIIDEENDCFIIADKGNRRVIRWSRQNNTENGETIISNIDCHGLTMDKNGSLYVSDYFRNEEKRWKRGEKNGTIVAGGNGYGNHLDQLAYPTAIFVNEDYSLYVSDRDNHRVIKWVQDAKEGIIVAGGNGFGNKLTQLSHPQGVTVDRLGQIYVTDYFNVRVMRWCEGGKEGTMVVGRNGSGHKSNQFNCPLGLSFDRQRNLYVVDGYNHRIQKFEIDFD